MSWDITLVHGNDHVREGTAEDFPEALKWAEDMERTICGSSEADPFGEMKKDFAYRNDDMGNVQFGTNYHYVEFKERWE